MLAIQKKVETGYTPRPLQALLHAALQRMNVIVCHRRFGKTVFSINELIDRALRNEREAPQYAFVAPTYGQAERIAWDMLKRYTRNIPGVSYNEQKLTCRIERRRADGSHRDFIKIMLLGAENPDSIRGIYLDGAVLDEFAEMDPRVWGQVLRPALADREGWAIFIGTPKGQNHFYDVYKVALANEGWFATVHKASETGVLPQTELTAMKAEMTDDEYEQEMECSFTAAITGAYWGKAISELENKKQITKVPFDPALLVDTFWDLGVDDTTTIWFVQQFRQEIRIIDYVEVSGEGIPYFAKLLKKDHRAEYNYREHHWPHDGNSRDFTSGVERSTVARQLGIKPLQVHKRFDVADSIDAARRLLPKCYFDKTRCTVYLKGDKGDKGARGLESLKNYQKKWDAKNKIYLDQPLHNWSSHGADAFRLLSMALRPGEDRAGGRKELPRSSENNYNVFQV